MLPTTPTCAHWGGERNLLTIVTGFNSVFQIMVFAIITADKVAFFLSIVVTALANALRLEYRKPAKSPDEVELEFLRGG